MTWDNNNRKMRERTCDMCGKVDTIRADNKSERCRSCATKKQHEYQSPHETHGWSSSRLYNVWKQMIQRCHNPKHPDYPKYGGRGIKVCKKWRKSFEAFKDDMGDKPYRWHIHRKDNDKGYNKSNCVYLSAYKHRKIHRA